MMTRPLTVPASLRHMPLAAIRSLSWHAVAAGALLLNHAPAQGVAAVGDLYITEEGSGEVLRHNGITGAPLGLFATAVGQQIMAVHTSTGTGHVLVGSTLGGVSEFHRDSGALIRTYNLFGGWQWAGVYAPNGDVLIGDMNTNDIRRYDPTDGSFLGIFGNVPGPADMRFGPNGNLFVCSFSSGGVYELNGATGSLVAVRAPLISLPNDIAFMADGRRIVTSMVTNQAHVFDAAWTQIATFAGTGWGRPHGIDISPHDGNIYVIDGVTQSVHAFHATSYAELNASFASIDSKPVDIEFRRPVRTVGTIHQFGSACAGLAMVAAGRPDIGGSIDLQVVGARPRLPALLFVGASATTWNGVVLPLRLDTLGAAGCALLVSGDVLAPTTTDARGVARIPLVIPADQGLIGVDLFFQWLVRDAAANSLGWVASDGAAVRIGG